MKEDSMKKEKTYWYDLKPSDDNKGFIYGINYIDDDEIIEFLESNEFEPDNNFYMVLIQSYQKLEDGSSSLRKTKYYEHWPKDYYADTVLVRKQYGDIHGKRNEKKS